MKEKNIKIIVVCITVLLFGIILVIGYSMNKQPIEEETTEEQQYATNKTTEYTVEETTEVLFDENHSVPSLYTSNDDIQYNNYDKLSVDQANDVTNLSNYINEYNEQKNKDNNTNNTVKSVSINNNEAQKNPFTGEVADETLNIVETTFKYSDDSVEEVILIYDNTQQKFIFCQNKALWEYNQTHSTAPEGE